MAGIYFQTLSSPEALSLSLATILWSISRAITALADGLNAAIDVPIQDTFFQKRLRALLQFLLLSVSVLGMLSFVVYGQQLLSYLQSSKSIHLASAHIFSILYLTTCFTVMYRILLCKKIGAFYKTPIFFKNNSTI
jgi:uncharacterized BrkB/YihY/UPF0761 family membrane protein